MGNDAVVPKQEVEIAFTPSNWERNVVNYIKFLKTYDLERLGIEMVPLTERYWEFNPSVIHRERRHRTYYNFVGKNPVAKHEGWVVLPEKAKLVVKDNITIQRMLEGLDDIKLVFQFPDQDKYYYYFPLFFRHVLDGNMFRRQLNEILDSLPPEACTTISRTLTDRFNDQSVEFEFIATDFAGWTFVRLAAIKYNGARFEHWIKSPGNTNVYQVNSENVGLLREDYMHFTKGSPNAICNSHIDDFTMRKRTVINKEMALHLHAGFYEVEEKFERAPNIFEVRYIFKLALDVVEPDYTMFLE